MAPKYSALPTHSHSPHVPSTSNTHNNPDHRRPLRSILRLLFFTITGVFALIGLLGVAGGEKGAAAINRVSLDRLRGVETKNGKTLVVEKMKILHLVDFETQELLMDRWLLHSHKGFANRTDIVGHAALWGPGFPGWAPSLSLSSNIATHFGRTDYFDAVLVYFNNDQMRILNIDPMPWFKQVKDLSSYGRGTVIIDRPHEMRDMRRAVMYEHANVSLVLSPYPSEIFPYLQFSTQALLAHQPHFVDPSIFFHPVEKARPQEVIIAGDMGAFYPFRHRLGDLILAGKGHPGYADIKPKEDRPATITADSQEQQLVDFGNDLSDAKICLVTCSRWGYSVQKYIEAAAAGCLIIGNVPLDRSTLFTEHLVPLSNADKDQHIIDTVRHWLIHEDDRIAKAKGMQEWILREFSLDRYVENVVRLVGDARAGQRGVVLPWEWKYAPEELPLDG